ncbi:SDR family oxidoreductase [Amycolatopsis cihanbeyliensis]|uniref:SDR family oxidoreductase n=1 Tax=Amycolatopsis cihanbeyliensis TaxID=1128664 RepID=UPI001FE95C9C|nr:SDR family oxidoreductase [Amycolatopsis cihanbeyliensis]
MTGGSRGIGRAVASKLAAAGAAVVFTYATRSDAADDLIADITASGGWARALPCDLGKLEQLEGVFTHVDRALAEAGAPGLDILVANAGIAAHGPIDEVDGDDWDRVFEVNARGCFFTLQHAARRMRNGGRVITVSTIGTAWPSPGETLYAASKAAVEQISRVASRELGSRGITVNTVSPGPTDTDLLRAAASPEAVDGAAAMTALGRIGQPKDIADVVALLAHPDSRWITGQNIRVDGGLT